MNSVDVRDRRLAWYTVCVLCLLFVFSFVDRLILGLLAVDIGRDLAISDASMGILIGTSFAVVYALAGVPVAHLLDAGNRKRILSLGVFLWSTSTIASGFAPSFTSLAFCRAGVALGEAVLTPAAISMIADMFPRDRRVLPTSIYAAMASLMGIGGLILGAAALEVAQRFSPAAGLPAWRLVLIFVGVPPLLLGALFAVTVREPERGRFDDPATLSVDAADFRSFLAYLRANQGFYGAFYAGTALILVFLFGMMTWTPALMIRGLGWAPASAGYVFGLVGLVTGLLGSIFWPRLIVRMGRRGWRDPIVLGMAIGCAAGAPFMIIGPSMPTSPLLLTGMTLSIFAGTSIAALTPLAMQHYGPPRLRARLMSFATLSQSLVGYGVGPAAIAMLAGAWPGDGRGLGYALSAAALVTVPGAALCFALARRWLRPSSISGQGSRAFSAGSTAVSDW